MTMPSEKKNALKELPKTLKLIFLRGKERPTLTELRRIFYYALKHYPAPYEIDEMIKKCPKIFKDKK